MKPRPYQEEIHQDIIAALKIGHRRILVQSGTGSGKTFIASRVMRGAVEKQNTATFLVPRRELAFQTQKALARMGVQAGIIMAGCEYTPHLLAQIASFDTLHARAMKRESIILPPSRVVLTDEAHLAMSDSRRAILDAYPDAIHLGLTATPARGDGRPLGDVYDHMVRGWPIRRMMDEGFLVECRYFSYGNLDRKAMTVRAGDFAEGEASDAMSKPKIIGDIVQNWMRIASDRSTVVFCVTQAHARAVYKAFKSAGVVAEYVDADTPQDERAAIFERMDSGQSLVLVNVFVASYGLDIPRLSCCVIARPTKSVVLYLQMVGRVLRPIYRDGEPEDAEGRLQSIAESYKPDALVIDHTGTVLDIGFVHYDFPWTLNGDTPIQDEADEQRKEKGEPKPITCSGCGTVFVGARFCPGCGQEVLKPAIPIPVFEHDLEEIEMTGRTANKKESWEQKVQFMGEAMGYARQKGYSQGWAKHKYREKYGVWPNDPRVNDARMLTPGHVIKNFIKYMAIRDARSGKNNGSRKG